MRINQLTPTNPSRSNPAASKSKTSQSGSATDSFTRGASSAYKATCRTLGTLSLASLLGGLKTRGQVAEEAASESASESEEESTSSTSEEESTATSEEEEENVSSSSGSGRGASSSTAWGVASANAVASVDNQYFLPYVAGQSYKPNSTYVPPTRGITASNPNITALPAGVVGMPVPELAQQDIEVQPVGTFTDPTDVHDFYDPTKGQTNPAVNCTMGRVNANQVVVGGAANLISPNAFQTLFNNHTNTTGNLTQVHQDLLAGMLNLTALPPEMLNVTALRSSCMAPPTPPAPDTHLLSFAGRLGVGIGLGVGIPLVAFAACCIGCCVTAAKEEHEFQQQQEANRIHARHGRRYDV